jgi:DNA polymerase-3 subunit gamma/tau
MTKPYQIFAREYRPQTFEEMVGQKAVVQTLQNAIKANRVAQAYIFAGMRGVGKTTAARILAKALNCLQGPAPTPTPCNVCESCLDILNDRSIDVLEIDGASNRGIDDVKTLRESVKYKPIRSRYKVVIIDEVHMLTREAFAALLKTLEEPPLGTVFIFATTELHKVPVTILSRCQVFEFKKPSPRDIVNLLDGIAHKESLTISAGGLALIAEASEGSIRDAVSLLDQAVAFCGETIGDAELKELLGAVNKDLLFEFSTAVLEEKPERIFSLTATVLDAGYDLRLFMKELIQHFRNILVVKSVPKPDDLIALASADELARLKAEAAKAGDEDLIRYLQAIQNAEVGLKFSPHPQIHFETTLVKICHYKKIASLKDLLLDIEAPGKGGTTPPEARPVKPAWSPPPSVRVDRVATSVRDDRVATAAPTGLTGLSATTRSTGSVAPRKADPPAALRDEYRIKSPAGPAPSSSEARPPEKAPGAPSGGPSAAAGETPLRKSEEEAALKDPGVKSFMHKFKARVITIEELKGKPESEEE